MKMDMEGMEKMNKFKLSLLLILILLLAGCNQSFLVIELNLRSGEQKASAV